MQKNHYPVAAALAVAFIFGLSFVFTKETLTYLSPFQLLGLRFGMAALSLTLLVALKIVKLNIKTENLPELIKIGLWQPVLYFIFETYGVNYTTASESGVVIALVPMAVMVLSIIILGERITSGQAVFIAAAVAGVAVIALAGPDIQPGAPSENHLIGIIMLFGAVTAAGFYSIFSRRASTRLGPFEITFVMMWLGAIVFNAIGLTNGYLTGQLAGYYTFYQYPSVVYGIVYLGLISSVAAFFLLNYTLSRIPASRAAVFFNLTPIVSLLAGIIINGERLGEWQLAGCGLILLGVWGTNHFAGRQLKSPGN